MLRRQTLTFLIITCVGHLLLISAQVQSRSGLSVLQTATFAAVARFQSVTGGALGSVRGIWTNYFALSGAARENAELRRRIIDLEAELQRQQALAARARTLEEALGLRESRGAPMIAARVVAGSPDPHSGTINIDQGARAGIRRDMGVVSGRGVVGRVVEPVAGEAATVQLLIDRNAAAAVTFERSGAGAIVRGGASDGTLRAEFLPLVADVRLGERVTTSGLDGIYPPGYLVGTVERIQGAGLDRRIVVRPAVDFSYVELVLVVLAAPPDKPGGGT
jgi:rod shape-determining protein MreC